MKKILGRIMKIDALIGAFLMAVIFIVVILQIASRILQGAWREFAHRVDQAITRDLAVAVRPC